MCKIWPASWMGSFYILSLAVAAHVGNGNEQRFHEVSDRHNGSIRVSKIYLRPLC